jgi:hypothetical protein
VIDHAHSDVDRLDRIEGLLAELLQAIALRQQAPSLLLSESAAAKALSISPRKLAILRQAGDVPFVRIGERSIRYEPDALRAYIKAREVPSS